MNPSAAVNRREFLAQSATLAAAAAIAAGAANEARAGTTTAPARAPATATARAIKTGIVYHDTYGKHLVPPGHPETPKRLDVIMKALAEPALAGKLLRVEPRAASDDELHACHTKEYVKAVRADVADGWSTLSAGDTDICADSLDAALLAAGGVLAAVDAVVAGKVKNAFCAVRPPGHHATPRCGMGFCIFNNVAVAARYAQARHKLARVLIVDWDVHHGNGTQDIFDEDPTVLLFSTHQWPLYPGTGREEETGKGKAKGTKINCPLPRGSGRKEIFAAFGDKLLPAAEKFKPELVLISAGFDSRKNDTLGGFTLGDDDFAELTKMMLDLAGRHAGGRVVSTLEGGYALEGLASAAAHVKALTEG